MITVRIPETLVGAFIDQYGKEIIISEESDGILLVTFHAVPSTILFGWMFGMKSVEIVEPCAIREKMVKLLEENKDLYSKKN